MEDVPDKRAAVAPSASGIGKAERSKAGYHGVVEMGCRITCGFAEYVKDCPLF